MQKPRYDTVLFDLDGTLTDSAEGIKRSLRHAMARHGEPLDEQAALDEYIGPPLHDTLKRHYQRDEAWYEAVVAEYRAFYETGANTEGNRVYPGIPRLLHHLKKQGVKLIVATSKPEASARCILAHFGLLDCFDEVCGATLDNTRTFKKDIIAHVVGQGWIRGRAVMVGDRAHDVEGALANALPVIGAAYGYGGAEEFASCEFVAQDVASLETYLCGTIERGTFIVFEGMDGAGKSTHVRLLAQKLRHYGYEVVTTREPGGEGCPVAEAIRALVLDMRYADMSPLTEAYLYAAARAQHVVQVIAPALEAGQVVISDRFVDSSIAYQGFGRGLGGTFIEQLNYAAVGNCEPDLVFFLSLDAQEAYRRNRKSGKAMDRLEQQEDDFRARVQKGFEALRGIGRFVAIEATALKTDVADQVEAVATARLRA